MQFPSFWSKQIPCVEVGYCDLNAFHQRRGRSVGHCQQVALSTCLHLGKIRKGSSQAMGAEKCTSRDGGEQAGTSLSDQFWGYKVLLAVWILSISRHTESRSVFSQCFKSARGKAFWKVSGTSAFLFRFQPQQDELQATCREGWEETKPKKPRAFHSQQWKEIPPPLPTTHLPLGKLGANLQLPLLPSI